MLDLIFGLPIHALVVHAVVVLLPLSGLAALALVAMPRWRRPYGPLALGLATVSTLLIRLARRAVKRSSTVLVTPSAMRNSASS